MPSRLLIGFLLILFCSFASAQPAEKDAFSLNLNEVDMRVLIDTVADITGKNFIVDPHVAGKVSVVTTKPMPAQQIYEIFLSILKVHGFAAAGNGNIVKIIPNVSAKQEPVVSSSPEGLLTRVVQVHHIDAAQLVPILAPLVPQHAFIAAFPDSNVVILSDTVANVNRLAQMIEQIDKGGDAKVEIIPVKYASAKELATTLTSLISSRGAGKTGLFIPSVVADEYTNSILLGGDPAGRGEIRQLIARLDKDLPRAGNTEVVYLHYALAKDIVTTLTGSKATAKGGGDISAQPKAEAASPQQDFDIRADEATNALVITASPDKMQSLLDVVKKLDIRRAQVHIEAIIVEVTYEKGQKIGIDWSTGSGDVIGKGNITGNGNRGLSNIVNAAARGLSVGYFVGGDLRTLLTAFAEDKDANILSTPSLVTMDNEEANVLVGQNIGIETGTITSAVNANPAAATTIARQDVGTKLNVTPQINEGNAIKLKVKQEVSSVSPTSADSGGGLTIDKREIETSVLVDDGKILVLGGLIRDDVSNTTTKIPLLGDIPYLGRVLFQYNNTSVVKRNLMVFIRTRILRDADSASALSASKYEDLRFKEQTSNRKGVYLMPQEHGPVLPNLAPNYPKAPVFVPPLKKR